MTRNQALATPARAAPAPQPKHRYARAIGILCALAAFLVLLAWIFDLPGLKSLLPGGETMKFNTALCLFLLGASLWRLAAGQASKPALALVITLAATALVQDGLGVKLGIDQLFMADPQATAAPGRMAPATAVALIASAASLLLAFHFPAAAVSLALLPGGLGLIALLGYFFDATALHTVKPFTSMALPTAALLTLFASGILAALARHGFMREFSGEQLGARTGRSILTWSAVVLLPLATLRLWGERSGLYGLEFGLALMVLIAGLTLATMAWFTARALNRDQARALLSQAVFEQIAEGIVVTDARANILAVNPGFTRITGYGETEVLGQNPRILQSGRQSRAFYESMWKVLDDHGFWKGEIENRRKSGQIYPEWLSLKAVRDAEGAVVHYIGVFADLSERLAEEQRLKALSRQLDLALEVGAIGTWNWNASRQTLEADNRLCVMFGLEAERAPRTLPQWLELIAPRAQNPLTDHLLAAPEQRAHFEADLEIRHGDGKPRILALRANGDPDPDDPDSIILVLRDVTESRAIEDEICRLNAGLERQVEHRTAELRAAMRELESFSYTVAHDLRTPLRSLEGFSQVLILQHAEQLDPQARDFLERIRAAGQRMGVLIDDILELARLSRCNLVYRALDLSALAAEITEELRRVDAAREVAVSIEPGLVAQTDPSMARVILGNLLSNAWKYTSRTEAAQVVIRREEQAQGEITYVVRDNGAGFDMKFAAKLFQPFHRLHHDDEFPGTGIGLASVARAVERLGGRVWAEAEVGRGATFWFTLEKNSPGLRS